MTWYGRSLNNTNDRHNGYIKFEHKNHKYFSRISWNADILGTGCKITHLWYENVSVSNKMSKLPVHVTASCTDMEYIIYLDTVSKSSTNFFSWSLLRQIVKLAWSLPDLAANLCKLECRKAKEIHWSKISDNWKKK